MRANLKRAALAAVFAFLALPVSAGASQRIVNGLESRDFPTVGALLFADSSIVTPYNAHHACSGVLIGCRTFLTAAQCVTARSNSLRWAVYLQHAGFLPVESVTQHPGFERFPYAPDLAVVTLAEDVQGIEPSKINSTHDLEQLGVGLPGVIVGFGDTGGRHWPDHAGIKRFGHVETATCSDPYYERFDDFELVCWDFLEPIGAPGEDSTTCVGDLGGALFMDFAGSLELVGVHAGSENGFYNCAAPASAFDFSVFEHREWIAEQLNGDSTSACGSGPEVGSILAPVRSWSGLLSQTHQSESFRIPILASTSRVLVTVNGTDDEDNAFDVDLFVKSSGEASPDDFDCAASGSSTFGACELDAPDEGFLSILVRAGNQFGRYQVTAVELNQEEAVCGNGIVELPEDCDGDDPGLCPTGPCTMDCTCPDAICGNSALEDPEECDDGDLVVGDGCDADCKTELASTCEAAPLIAMSHGNYSLRGDLIRTNDSRTGCGGRSGDAWYRFSIDEPTLMMAAVRSDFAPSIALYRGDCSEYFFSACERLRPWLGPHLLAAGDYILIIGGAEREDGPFRLDLTLLAPGCGNGIREDDEACDGSDYGSCAKGTCTEGCTCEAGICGNGIRESGETCDGDDTTQCQYLPCGDDCSCPPPMCGNGLWENPGEECDGAESPFCGNRPCGEDCQCAPPVCGNGVAENVEECDGDDLGICAAGPCTADCDCPAPFCGNGIREPGTESCDGEDLGSCLVGPCSDDCECPAAVCGNSVTEYGENCDGPDLGFCPAGPCQENCDCPAPVCGNGVQERNEQCDGADLDFCDAAPCQPSCTCPKPVCGNDIQESGEACDGLDTDDRTCRSGLCKPNCLCMPTVCGNGIVEYGEQCDGPNLDRCRRGPCEEDCSCPPPVCGNSVVESGEDCDHDALGDCLVGPCQENCTCPAPVCGNNIVEEEEECDGADAVGCYETYSCEDDCTCTPPVCGNGIKESPEKCDGADLGVCRAGPCTSSCTCPPPVCGNDVRETGEECDGSDATKCPSGLCTDYCACPAVCGDYQVEGDEECEVNDDSRCASGECLSDCTCGPPVCGNDIVEPGERCDSSAAGGCPTSSCDDDCTCPDAVCGNELREDSESCDGSDSGLCDSCSPDCRCDAPPACDEAVEVSPSFGTHEVGGDSTGAADSGVGCGGEGGDVWYRLSLSRYSVVIVTPAPEYDFAYALTSLSGSCDSLSYLGCRRSGYWDGSIVGPVALGPGDYYYVMGGEGTEEGEHRLSFEIAPWECSDADGDGSVDSADALQVLRRSVDIDRACSIFRCDTNGDRNLTTSDALTVLRAAVGLAVELYCPLPPPRAV